MVAPNTIEIPNAALPPGPGTLTIVEKEYTGGAQGISSTTPVQITGTQQIFALAGTQDVMFVGFASADPNAQLIANVGFGINIDGVDYYGTFSATPNLGVNVEAGLFVSKGLSLGPGNHTVYLFAYRVSGLYNAGSIASSVTHPSRWEAIFGGGADAPNEPVVGGSGTQYLTIGDAIAGETETRVAGNVPQAGTGPGVLVGPGALSAVDDFYKDWFVVNTDTTPTNGLVAQWARVASYVGATRTMTLDKPWNFSAESTFLLVDPVRLTQKQDLTEDVTVNKCAVIDFGGNRMKGKIDITAAEFCWIRGANGYVTNGIQKTDFGILKIDECAVSRRDSTIYALLMTSGSDLGRCELTDCDFMGRVSGRRGYSGWSIKNCRNDGVPSNSNFDNLPFTLVESIAGIAIALTSMDMEVDSEFGGAMFYSENSITGATAFISAMGVVRGAQTYFDSEPSPRNFSIVRCVGAGNVNITHTVSRLNLTFMQLRSPATLTNSQPVISIISLANFSGSCTFNIDVSNTLTITDTANLYFVFVEGSSDCSGTATCGGASAWTINGTGSVAVNLVRLSGRLTGSVSVSQAAANVLNIVAFVGLAITVSQNSGTPTVTISCPISLRQGISQQLFSITAGFTVNTGTWTISGLMALEVATLTSTTWSTSVTGGTWNVSAQVLIDFKASNSTGVSIFIHAGTGGTVSISNVVSISCPQRPPTSTFISFLASSTGAGTGTLTLSGTVTISYLDIPGASEILLAKNTAAGNTAAVTGSVFFYHCSFENTVTIINATTAGGTVQGPSLLEFEFCYFGNTLTTDSGSGTITWTGATIRYKNCHIEGLYTAVYTHFTTHEAFHTRFNGNASNKCVTGTGTRPTTLRYWKCSFAARFDDLQPEVLDIYDILPAQAALVQGQPVKVNAANQYQVCVAASIVDGVALAAAGGAGTILIAVRQGRLYVTCKAGTVNGDNLVLDLATPTQANQGAFLAGQEIGTALENVGAVVAGKCYTAVNVR
jgi:hypothetical protein